MLLSCRFFALMPLLLMMICYAAAYDILMLMLDADACFSRRRLMPAPLTLRHAHAALLMFHAMMRAARCHALMR